MNLNEYGLVELTIDQYNELARANKILNALYAGGVDNWEWYSESIADLGLDEDDDED